MGLEFTPRGCFWSPPATSVTLIAFKKLTVQVEDTADDDEGDADEGPAAVVVDDEVFDAVDEEVTTYATVPTVEDQLAPSRTAPRRKEPKQDVKSVKAKESTESTVAPKKKDVMDVPGPQRQGGQSVPRSQLQTGKTVETLMSEKWEHANNDVSARHVESEGEGEDTDEEDEEEEDEENLDENDDDDSPVIPNNYLPVGELDPDGVNERIPNVDLLSTEAKRLREAQLNQIEASAQRLTAALEAAMTTNADGATIAVELQGMGELVRQLRSKVQILEEELEKSEDRNNSLRERLGDLKRVSTLGLDGKTVAVREAKRSQPQVTDEQVRLARTILAEKRCQEPTANDSETFPNYVS